MYQQLWRRVYLADFVLAHRKIASIYLAYLSPSTGAFERVLRDPEADAYDTYLEGTFHISTLYFEISNWQFE
jgi:hypothetical protein